VTEWKTGYAASKSPCPAVNMLWLILSCTLFLVGGK